MHSKVVVNDKVITAPSYLIKSEDKIKLIGGFAPRVKKIVREPIATSHELPAEKKEASKLSRTPSEQSSRDLSELHSDRKFAEQTASVKAKSTDSEVVEELSLKATKEENV